jgi:hypothetical protein
MALFQHPVMEQAVFLAANPAGAVSGNKNKKRLHQLNYTISQKKLKPLYKCDNRS